MDAEPQGWVKEVWAVIVMDQDFSWGHETDVQGMHRVMGNLTGLTKGVPCALMRKQKSRAGQGRARPASL